MSTPVPAAQPPPISDQQGFTSVTPKGSMELGTLDFLNEITPFVPVHIRNMLWGYVNRLTSVSKFTPRQADAELDRINAVAMLVKMSIPRRKMSAKLILDLDNFIDFCKKQVWRAVIPRNERELLATQVSEVVQSQPSQRRKLFGLF
jgi:hypothetical protein